MLRAALPLAMLILWLYCLFDVITTDESRMRNLPKFGWLFVVVFLFVVGSVFWLVLGRPAPVRRPPLPPRRGRGARPPAGPEDSPDFMSRFEEQFRPPDGPEEDER